MKTEKVDTLVWAKIKVHGFHHWADAPIGPRRYLANDHRHLFTVRVIVHVSHDDRDVEFHDIQAETHFALNRSFNRYESSAPAPAAYSYDFGSYSCEQIAVKVRDGLPSEWDVTGVEVTEDDECGALVRFTAA